MAIGTIAPLLSMLTDHVFNTVEEAAKFISSGKFLEKNVWYEILNPMRTHLMHSFVYPVNLIYELCQKAGYATNIIYQYINF